MCLLQQTFFFTSPVTTFYLTLHPHKQSMHWLAYILDGSKHHPTLFTNEATILVNTMYSAFRKYLFNAK